MSKNPPKFELSAVTVDSAYALLILLKMDADSLQIRYDRQPVKWYDSDASVDAETFIETLNGIIETVEDFLPVKKS